MRYILLYISIISVSFNIQANEKTLNCPDNTKEISGEGVNKGEKSIVKGCIDSNGKLHGTSLTIVNGITVDQCTYIHGMENGTCISWYNSGEKMRSMQYKNGVPHGEVIGWHENGTIELKAFHDNGKPVGTWKSWDQNGKLINVIKY